MGHHHLLEVAARDFRQSSGSVAVGAGMVLLCASGVLCPVRLPELLVGATEPTGSLREHDATDDEYDEDGEEDRFHR